MIAPGGIMPMGGGAAVPLNPPQTGLLLWLKTPIPGLSNGDDLNNTGTPAFWIDQSPNAYNCGGSASDGNAANPTYSTGTTINGFPTCRNVGANNQFLAIFVGLTGVEQKITNGLSSVTACIVGKVDNDPATGINDCVTLGQYGDDNGAHPYDHVEVVPWTDSHWYVVSYRRTRVDIGIPAPNLTSPHYYIVRSSSSLYDVTVNGTTIFTTATNTVNVNDNRPTRIGNAKIPFADGGGDVYMTGNYSEAMIYDHALNSTELADLEAYLHAKYGL
jgi:hypothetical protein